MTLEQAAREVLAKFNYQYVSGDFCRALGHLRAALAAPVGEGQRCCEDHSFAVHMSTQLQMPVQCGMCSVAVIAPAVAQRIKAAAAHESAEAAGEQSAAPPDWEATFRKHLPAMKAFLANEPTASANASASRAPAAGPSAGDSVWYDDPNTPQRIEAKFENGYLVDTGNVSAHLPVRELQAEPVAWTAAIEAAIERATLAAKVSGRTCNTAEESLAAMQAAKDAENEAIALVNAYAAQECPPAERTQVPPDLLEFVRNVAMWNFGGGCVLSAGVDEACAMAETLRVKYDTGATP